MHDAASSVSKHVGGVGVAREAEDDEARVSVQQVEHRFIVPEQAVGRADSWVKWRVGEGDYALLGSVVRTSRTRVVVRREKDTHGTMRRVCLVDEPTLPMIPFSKANKLVRVGMDGCGWTYRCAASRTSASHASCEGPTPPPNATNRWSSPSKFSGEFLSAFGFRSRTASASARSSLPVGEPRADASYASRPTKQNSGWGEKD